MTDLEPPTIFGRRLPEDVPRRRVSTQRGERAGDRVWISRGAKYRRDARRGDRWKERVEIEPHHDDATDVGLRERAHRVSRAKPVRRDMRRDPRDDVVEHVALDRAQR